MKKLAMNQILSVLLALLLSLVPVAPATATDTYSDIAGHWAEEDILSLSARGIIEGVGDGLFLPEGTVTRAEFLALVVRAFQLKENSETPDFSDVTQADWFYSTVAAGGSLIPEAMTPGGRLLPDQPITREEMAVILSGAAGGTDSADLTYTDRADISDWALAAVQNVTAQSLMKGSEGQFMPRGLSTRAQAAAVLNRAVPAPAAEPDVKAILAGHDFSNLPVSTPEGRAAYPAADIDVDIRSVETEFGTLPATEEEFARRFPISQQMRPIADMKYISGVGMLAYFEEGGPREVYIRREAAAQHNPATTRFKQFCTARVIDPDGEVVCYYDFSEKDLLDDAVVFRVPEGKAGIYQISYKNGQNNVDDITIGLPESRAWAIRGEPSLCFTEKTAKEWYLYVPRTSKHVVVFTRGSQKAQIDLYDEAGTPFSKDTQAPLKNFDITVNKTDVVWKLVFSGTENAAVTFERGVPQILCPTEEMARFLKGNTREAEGLLVSGDLQAQVREIAYSMKDHNFDVDLTFLEDIPEDVTEYDIENLMFGVYSGLGCLSEETLKNQCLDPTHPYYGGTNTDGIKITEYDTWEDFEPPRRWSLTTAASLAAMSSIPTKLNAAYGNRALIDRAVLNAFCHFASMDNQFLIRESNGSPNQFWPSEHSFFIYPSLATCYNLLKDKIDPETQKVFRRALILVGDNLANNINSQTNQWSESIMGHLETYLATGEKRFLEYYERHVATITSDNVDRATGSYGQHPAGYFMENNGPEGSYQELSMHKVVGSFLYYKNLPEAKPELVEKLTDAIDRAVTFESLFWLPQPNGALVSPNALNTRSTMMLSNQGYPGFTMAATVNPLAAKVLELLPVTPENVGSVATMPQGGLNKPDVSKSNILQGLAGKNTRWPSRVGFNGFFIPMVYNAFRQPERVAAAGTAPVHETDKIWDLQGLMAFKRGKLYGMTYYDSYCTSPYAAYPAARSPLPFVLWTEKLGAVVLAMNNKNIAESERPQMGYSGVMLQRADGSWVKTQKENSTFRWIKEGYEYVAECALPEVNGSMKVRGKITAAGLSLSVTVSAADPLQSAWLSLPINMMLEDAVVTGPENGSFTFAANGETLHIDYPETANAYFDDFVIDSGTTPKIRALKIELPLYNRPLNLNFHVE